MEVIIDGVKYVPAAPHRFKVGDFVRLTIHPLEWGEDYAQDGAVSRVQDDHIGVVFPSYNKERHDLAGSTTLGHGWWVHPYELELIQ